MRLLPSPKDTPQSVMEASAAASAAEVSSRPRGDWRRKRSPTQVNVVGERPMIGRISLPLRHQHCRRGGCPRRSATTRSPCPLSNMSRITFILFADTQVAWPDGSRIISSTGSSSPHVPAYTRAPVPGNHADAGLNSTCSRWPTSATRFLVHNTTPERQRKRRKTRPMAVSKSPARTARRARA